MVFSDFMKCSKYYFILYELKHKYETRIDPNEIFVCENSIRNVFLSFVSKYLNTKRTHVNVRFEQQMALTENYITYQIQRIIKDTINTIVIIKLNKHKDE